MRRYRFSAILACCFFSLFSLGAFASPSVTFETTLGSFTVELNAKQAPVTVKNFLRYVEDGSYVGSIFHRVIPGFMVQGGGFSTQMERLKTYPPIANEANNGLLNQTGTIAMARTQDPNSATRQFFINLVDNDFLNAGERPPGYAVFGRVTTGFDVIQKIGQQKTGVRNYMKDVPVEPIIITRVFVVPEKGTAATTSPAQ
ncbi:peptidylprolyl isomerase [Vibrio rhizosphaerae]|uniref:Peptidyl-prolyl cis-trans isomerase n=1 Tax=Vibrio rhizosphaerae TaxID=398736 RepID=A0ABU4IW91_9VIBR|nr:peptidylprolyl isomerase [Vibrio rhizosphaerae]MDW6093669.1 peptidylprolyl isomerase [Vibrio rhizosphaerae]